MYFISKCILITVLSLQMAFAATVNEFQSITQSKKRSPAQIENTKSVNKKIDIFFKKVWGAKTNSCKDNSAAQYRMAIEQMLLGNKPNLYQKSEFDMYIDQIKVNACSSELFSKQEKVKKKECKIKRTQGVIDQIKNSNEEYLILSNLNKLFREAKIIKEDVQTIIDQNEIEDEELNKLLKNYIEKILSTFHDLSVLYVSINEKRQFNYIRFLSFNLPSNITDDNKRMEKILNGANDFGPYFFKINERNNIEVNTNSTLQRDILTLLRFPNKERFILALRWQAISMLLIQLRFQGKLMDKKEVRIPNSCINNINNNIKNEKIFSNLSADQNIENILINNRLIVDLRSNNKNGNELNQQAREAEENRVIYNQSFMEDLYEAPMSGGGEEITPIENYNYSMRAIENSFDVDIDDYVFFEKVLDLKYSEYKRQFVKADGWYWLWQNKNYLESKAFSYFQKLISFPTQKSYLVKTKDNRDVELDTEIQKYTVYIYEQMQKKGVENLEELISLKLEKKLKTNIVLIDFPRKFGSLVNRNWATTLLRDTVLKFEGNNSLEYWLKASFREVRKTDKLWISSKRFNYKEFRKIFSGLVQEDFLPISFYKRSDVNKYWPFFARLWRNLRDFTGLLDQAKLSEYDYLMAQIEANNPWANARVSYLLSIEELSNEKNNKFKVEEQNSCFDGKINTVLSQVKKAGSVLKLNKILKPSFANYILNKEQKRTLWLGSLEKLNEKFANILNEKFGGKNINKMLDKLVGARISNLDDIEEFQSALDININPKDYKKLTDFGQSKDGRKVELLSQLYNASGDLDKQINIMDVYADEFGIIDSMESRELLTQASTIYKLPLYKAIIKRGSIAKYLTTINNLQHLCSSRQDDFDKTKDFYFSTINAQNKLNSMIGKPIIPTKDVEKIKKVFKEDMDSFSPEEVKDFFLAGAMVISSIGAMALGGACTVGSGGLCLPVGGAMGAFGLATMGIQIELFSNELKRLLRSYESEDEVRRFASSGLSNLSDVDTISRSKAWTIIEGISILPFIGLTTKSFKAGARIVGRGTIDMVRGNKSQIGIHARQILAEEDIMFAKHVAGFNYGIESAFADTLGGLKQLKNGQWAKAQNRFKKIKELFKSGKISQKEFLAISQNLGEELAEGLVKRGANIKKIVLESTDDIHSQIARQHSKYFNHSFKRFGDLVDSYVKKVPHARKVLAAIESGKSKWRFVPFANWYRSTRYKHLVKYGKALTNLSKELKAAKKTGESLESFVKKRSELLTDIFSQIPMRKRDMPYAFLFSGGAHMGGLLGGKGLPFFSKFAGGLVMRKLYSASARLNYEAMATASKKALGIDIEMASITAGESIRAFNFHFNKTLPRMSKVEQRINKKQMKMWQTKVAKMARIQAKQHFMGNKKLEKVLRMFQKGKNKSFNKIQFDNIDHIKKILFNPESTQERVMFDLLWSKLDRDKIFKMQDLGEMAYNVAAHLSKIESKSMFESLKSALKIISITKDPGVVEIM